MKLEILKVDVPQILPLRVRYVNELNCQIRYNACHERNWSDSYLISIDDINVGYGSIKGRDELSRRDAIFEFYLVPQWRNRAVQIYEKLILKSEVKYLECQTNDFLHSSMVFEFGTKISSSTALFEDHHVTMLNQEDAEVRRRISADRVFEKNKDAGSHVLVVDGEVVASGGFLLHYNLPYADLYMETRHDVRGTGYASFLLQELKKICYEVGRVPAARCNIKNVASRATLLKSGMRVCGYMLQANIK